MTSLPEDLFANPAWHALHTRHRHLALVEGEAGRYPADVAPFAALAAPTRPALRQLAELLSPSESVWLFDETLPADPALAIRQSLPCLQMALPREVDLLPAPSHTVLSLSADDATDMVALTDLAFPGFFRRRTCAMGSYFGIRIDGALVAMGGERLLLNGYPEISGVCTHPAHRGQGYAASLIGQLVQQHRRNGEHSWLHVTARNQHAADLYLRLGFVVARHVTLTQVARPA